MPGAKSSKKNQPRIKPKIRWDRVLLIAILPVLIAVFLGVYALYRQPPTDKIPAAEAAQPEVLKNQLNILLLGTNEKNQTNQTNQINETSEIETSEIEKNIDGSINQGNHYKESDAIVLACISPNETNLKLLSIPCNTKVSIPGVKGSEKINLAFSYGGARLAQATVEQLLKIPVHHYIVVDWQEFIKIIDAFGGVDLYVENNMNYYDPYDNLEINLKKGYQRLDGEKAGHYVRFRSDELGDIGRLQRQQRFLKVFLQQVVRLETVLKLPSLLNAPGNLADTDMSVLTMVKAANTLKNFKMDATKTEILPGTLVNIDGLSYWEPDEGKIKQVVETMFYSPNINPPEGEQPK